VWRGGVQPSDARSWLGKQRAARAQSGGLVAEERSFWNQLNKSSEAGVEASGARGCASFFEDETQVGGCPWSAQQHLPVSLPPGRPAGLEPQLRPLAAGARSRTPS
jgi:hypothetical protein